MKDVFTLPHGKYINKINELRDYAETLLAKYGASITLCLPINTGGKNADF
jgi:hypothetical protein